MQPERLPFQREESGGTVYGQHGSYHDSAQEQQHQVTHHDSSKGVGLRQSNAGRLANGGDWRCAPVPAPQFHRELCWHRSGGELFQKAHLQEQSHDRSWLSSPAQDAVPDRLYLSHRTPADEPVYQFLNKKRAEGKTYFVYMTAAQNKFLRIYYSRVKK